MALTPEHKRQVEAMAHVVRILGQAGVDFALILHPQHGRKSPLFFASDPPPTGAQRARAALDECERLEGLMVAGVPDVH